MKQLLIIPDKNMLIKDIELSKKYGFGFEYNDFFKPDILLDDEKSDEIIATYKSVELPQIATLHGAFFDVIPYSMDSDIRDISDKRIRKSIEIARKIKAGAVIFHTNYNPFLNTEGYIKYFVEANTEYWKSILTQNDDVNIYLENMFDTTPYIMKCIAERLCGYENFGICLDYAHAAISNEEPVAWAKELGKYVKHIHLNDNDRISDLHLAWGDGKIKRDEFYESYEKYMKGATVLLETNSMENKLRSLEMLEKEGFIG